VALHLHSHGIASLFFFLPASNPKFIFFLFENPLANREYLDQIANPNDGTDRARQSIREIN
jgi:hypothetical protein